MSRILITGAAGMVGRRLVSLLAQGGHDVLVTDIAKPSDLPDGIRFLPMDVTGADPAHILPGECPDAVIHLASVLEPKNRELAYKVDVTGTRNVLSACLTAKVKRLVVTSSGAAYGYHADNAAWLRESDPVRGNPEFPYSDHKRQVEMLLAAARRETPHLEQVVLRVCTVLGAGVENQITSLFRRPRLIALNGSASPFVFIWTEDLARILERAATDGPPGTFNVAGDGALSMADLADILGKPLIRLPAWLVKTALAVAKPLGLSRFGPEQVRFLQYRPVLDNQALKTRFGYTPALSSAEVFELWRKEAGL
ncbi:SDR family oxidoreductase [Roseibium denhamense]|uniref:UDP-glucose 4-epimerase n=1 Tax=Roseibium denhamense TaxID=76305 RepID=A0ABY1NNV1_9HYPH|nr:SDR family oxidoreductase [Roseibium denhamense]MTI07850.1 SDR family oxidoreductase [Roseibium denhamense]SMP14434.1 UDP-glucose 4-epimerase [Roseibium denhamense]